MFSSVAVVKRLRFFCALKILPRQFRTFPHRNLKERQTKANESKNASVFAHNLLIYINNNTISIVFSRKYLFGVKKHRTFANVIKRVTPQDH